MLIFLIILGVISSRMRSILGICANPINLEFLAGSWLGFAYVRGHRLKFGISITLIGLGVAMLMLSYFLIQRGISTVPLWGIPALCIVSGMVHAENRRDFSSVSKIAALGDASYFLYLSHILLLTIMNKLLPLNIPDFVFLTSSTCLVWALFCVAISRIGHLVIELPLIGALQDHKFRNKVSIK
jgi:exopolysaccharide production protein ExoZ